MKNTLLFLCSTNILVCLRTVNMKNCLTPKNPKMCDPILVTLFKKWPHFIQSSCENATPSSSTSLLASYKDAPPPRPRGMSLSIWQNFCPQYCSDSLKLSIINNDYHIVVSDITLCRNLFVNFMIYSLDIFVKMIDINAFFCFLFFSFYNRKMQLLLCTLLVPWWCFYVVLSTAGFNPSSLTRWSHVVW